MDFWPSFDAVVSCRPSVAAAIEHSLSDVTRGHVLVEPAVIVLYGGAPAASEIVRGCPP